MSLQSGKYACQLLDLREPYLDEEVQQQMRQFIGVTIAVIVAIASFALAFAHPDQAWLFIPLYLAASLTIASCCKDWRLTSAAFAALAIATLIPQLRFFPDVQGPKAYGLWMLMVLWQFIPTLAANLAIQKWRWTEWLVPLGWTLAVFARCELNPFRFAMATPGHAMTGASADFLHLGEYSCLFLALLALVSLHQLLTNPDKDSVPDGRVNPQFALGALGFVVAGLLLLTTPLVKPAAPRPGPFVVGIQGTAIEPSCPDGVTLECQPTEKLVEALDYGFGQYPEGDIYVLPEYATEGWPPQQVCDWARIHGKFVIIGGRAGRFNAVFVVERDGSVHFWQAKVQPVYGLPDGDPAETQTVWDTQEWGPIGICVCYDLSLYRVIARLADMGATGIICPAMDLYRWGKPEHEANARFAQIRAAELGLPVFRVGGISQLVDASGKIIAEAGFPPARLQAIGGRMELTAPRRTPDWQLLKWIPAPLVHDPL